MGNRDVTSGEKAAEEMNVNGARMRIEEESNVGDGGDVEEVSQVGSKQNYEDQLKEANKWILEYFMHMAKAVFIKGEQYRFKQLYDLMEGVMELPIQVVCSKMARQLRCLQVIKHYMEMTHYEGVNQEKKKEQMANEIFDLLLRSGTVEDGDTEELRNIQKKFCSPSCQFEGWKKQLLQRFLELNLPEHEIHLLKAVRCSLEEPLPITKEANYNKTDESEHFSSDETNDLAKIMKKTPFCSLFDDSQDSSEIFEPPKGDEWTRQMRKWSPGVMKTRFFKAQRKHSILLQKETKYAIGKLQTRLQIIPQLGGKQRKGSGLIRRRSGSEKVCRFMESASGH
uniref:uncharacterized protein isoform X3 n=1 Tax=Myxine glutinosa TaxID=7769 RepID=UPI00358FFB89